VGKERVLVVSAIRVRTIWAAISRKGRHARIVARVQAARGFFYCGK
jgi:hypothetical protein